MPSLFARIAARFGLRIAAATVAAPQEVPAKRKRTNNGAGGRASMQRVTACECGRSIKGPAAKKHQAKCEAHIAAVAARVAPSQADLAAMAEPKAPPLPLGMPAQL